MTDLFLRMLNTSVASCWLIGAVLLLRFLFRRWAPKWVVCLLWGIVALRLVLPFNIQIPFGLIPEQATNVSAVFEIVRQTDETDIPFNSAAEESISEVPGSVQNAPAIQPSDPQPVRPSVSDQMPDAFIPVEPVAETTPIRWSLLLAIVWVSGCAAMLIYAAVYYFVLRRRLSDALPYQTGVKQSERVRSPFVLGLFKPVIYLPFGLDKQTEALVLAHERAHIARGDHWLKCGWFAVLAFHWFNPLTWIAFVLFCGDIEYACDERVFGKMDSEERKVYAEALLRVGMSSHRIAACPVAFGETNVKKRVLRICTFKKPAAWMLVSILILCLALTACFSAPGWGESIEIPSDASDPTESEIERSESSGSAESGTVSEPAGDQSTLLFRYRAVSYIDQNTGISEEYTYNEYGELIKTVRSDGSETEYAYNASGHPLTEIHRLAGKVQAKIEWSYDNAGRLVEETKPGCKTTFEYDQSGKLSKRTENGVVYMYSYVENGCYSTTATVNGVKYLTYYTVSGKMIRMTTGDGQTVSKRLYGNSGDLLEIQTYQNGDVYEYTRYEYDGSGSLIKKTVSTEPGSEYTLRYDRTREGTSDILISVVYVAKDGSEKPFGSYRLTMLSIRKDPDRYDSRADLPPEQNCLANRDGTGRFERSLEELRETFPQFFNCSAEKGLVIYCYAIAHNTYWCGLAETPDAPETETDLFGLWAPVVSPEEMKTILPTYSIPDEAVVIWPNSFSLSSYIEPLEQTGENVSALFENRYRWILPGETVSG